MANQSIARQSYEISQKKGGVALPEGVTGKVFTIYREGKPYQTAIVLPDGSELTLGRGGETFHTGPGAWEPEHIAAPTLRD